MMKGLGKECRFLASLLGFSLLAHTLLMCQGPILFLLKVAIKSVLGAG